jgi:hypothetical protein
MNLPCSYGAAYFDYRCIMQKDAQRSIIAALFDAEQSASFAAEERFGLDLEAVVDSPCCVCVPDRLVASCCQPPVPFGT